MSKPNGATAEGTRRYAARLASSTAAGHFRQQLEMSFSSIGLGTYLGHWDERTDRMYEESVKRAVERGCNVIDSAINYRFQRSERAIGSALKQLFESGKASRDEVIIATKGGFFSFDNEAPGDHRAWVIENLINTGIAKPEDIVDSHCMSPGYLEDQLSRSLRNLGLDTIDVYYVHNPESQLEGVPRPEFLKRVRAAFEFLETAAQNGRIKYYGTATWNGYRQSPESHEYLSLEGLCDIAREISGDRHHFRVIQLPYNLMMPEALTSPNQTADGEQMSILEAATRLGVTVMCSATLWQSKLAQELPGFISEALTGLNTDAQRAIQFVRSTPGVTTALVGMSQRAHVDENLQAASVPPAPIEDFLKLFPQDQ